MHNDYLALQFLYNSNHKVLFPKHQLSFKKRKRLQHVLITFFAILDLLILCISVVLMFLINHAMLNHQQISLSVFCCLIIISLLYFELIDINTSMLSYSVFYRITHPLCWLTDPIQVAITFNNNPKPLKELPDYNFMESCNIPKDIPVLLITKFWFIMFNKKGDIIGFMKLTDNAKNNQAICQYIYKNCFIEFVK